jgi:hypothetical protein
MGCSRRHSLSLLVATPIPDAYVATGGVVESLALFATLRRGLISETLFDE